MLISFEKKLRLFLRKHLDEVTNQKSNGRKQRVRICSDQFSEELSPPSSAPEWTKSGYNGPLRRRVVSVDENEEDASEIDSHERQQKKKKRKR
jgi:hypothetical protein